MDDQGRLKNSDLRHRLEIPERVVGNLFIQGRIDDIAVNRNEDRVTIRRRPRGLTSADIAAGAGDILDIELLSHPIGKLLRDQTPTDIGRAARRIWHDPPNRSGRIGLRLYPS